MTVSPTELLATQPLAAPSARRRGSGLFAGWSPAVVFLLAVLLLLILPPFYYLLKTSLLTTKIDGAFGHFTLQYYRDLFGTPRFVQRFWNSTVFAVGSAMVAVVLGGLEAWIVERTDTPLRRYVFLIAVVSLGIPHVLYAIAWLLILEKHGPVNSLLMQFLQTDTPLLDANGMWGMILVEGMIWTSMAFLLLSSVFRTADASFEEAAMMSGASIFGTFRHITLKLAMPALMALLLLVCIRAFESFDIPALVGEFRRRHRVDDRHL